VVGADRASAVAGLVGELDQEAVALLAQRVVRDQPLGAADRLRPALAVAVPARESLERVEVQLREPLALVRQPLVVTALQQLAGVQLDGLLEPPLGHRALELLDVEPQRSAPLQRARPDVDEPVGVGQGAPQRVEDLAQVRLRLGIRGVGPKQERDALSRLGRVAVQQQVGEERLGSRRVQRPELALSEPDVDGPEQSRAQRFRDRDRNGRGAGRTEGA
jgi:hypothetical protein